MKCPSCNYENQVDSKFCSQCGAKLCQQCLNCGVKNIPLDAKFCPVCGQALTPTNQSDYQFYTVNGVTFKMIKIPGGTFSLGETTVTQELWKAVMNNNMSCIQGAQHPAVNITWEEAELFIIKLNQLTSTHFRFPTQAEMEFAAKGGYNSENYIYAGSNDIDEVAWYKGNSNNTLHPVKQKKPNEIGLYDMTGNVWQFLDQHDRGFFIGYRDYVFGGGYTTRSWKCQIPAVKVSDSEGETDKGLRLAL